MSVAGKRSGTSIEALGPDGSRFPVEGTGIVAALGDGRELLVDFFRHPMGGGGVILRSDFVPPGTEPGPQDHDCGPEVFACLTLHPGGVNLMRVGIQAVSREPGGLRIEEWADAPGPGLFSATGGKRTPIATRTVVLTLGNGANLMVGVGTAPGQGPPDPRPLAPPGMVGFHAGLFLTPGEVARAKAGGFFPSSSLQVSLGAANVVHILVQQEKEARGLRGLGDVVDAWVAEWNGQETRDRIVESASRLGPGVLGELVERAATGEGSTGSGARGILALLTGLDPDPPPTAGAGGESPWREWWRASKGRFAYDPETRRFVVR